MLQGDPQVRFASTARLPNIAVLQHLWRTRGAGSWFLGAGVGITRTVPKYVAAIAAKDLMESWLPQPSSANVQGAATLRSATKSVVAGTVGAVLTNPLDVLQNEMFKTEERVGACLKRLCKEEGARWLFRGCRQNIVASALPIAATIFLTDTFAGWRAASRG
mmetsp:Transcript_67528/g.218220  ORF Transcript_67528/g.218220 Transcript_67528/m.218220 type:complete len:162 (+) Transcript_67528:376-861(+)